MIALDTSAIVAIAVGEPERRRFSSEIASCEALVGVPTLLETRLVLTSRIGSADAFLDRFLRPTVIHVVPFSMPMYHAAVYAFERFGKGRGHPAKLKFGDCMAYAVAKHHDVPLLYKGEDFALTDIRPAIR